MQNFCSVRKICRLADFTLRALVLFVTLHCQYWIFVGIRELDFIVSSTCTVRYLFRH